VFVFLLMAAAIAVLSWYAMAEALAGGDAVAFKVARKNHIIKVIILIFVLRHLRSQFMAGRRVDRSAARRHSRSDHPRVPYNAFSSATVST